MLVEKEISSLEWNGLPVIYTGPVISGCKAGSILVKSLQERLSGTNAGHNTLLPDNQFAYFRRGYSSFVTEKKSRQYEHYYLSIGRNIHDARFNFYNNRTGVRKNSVTPFGRSYL